MYRFAGFELDEQRAELRGPGGTPVKLRRKTFEMLRLFAANAGRVLSKEELMAAVWPHVHVSDDSLFQCIRELRTALGDDERQLIKAVSGRGYLFEAEVTQGELAGAQAVEATETGGSPAMPAVPKPLWRNPVAIAAAAGLFVLAGLAFAAPYLTELVGGRGAPTLAVASIVEASGDGEGAATAVAVTTQLVDGLAKIGSVRVIAPTADAARADLVLQGELQRDGTTWTLQTRLVERTSGAVRSVGSVSVDGSQMDAKLMQLRLATGVGEPLARDLNALIEDASSARATGVPSDTGGGKVAIAQATASISQTSRERFADAEIMLQAALAAEPDNVDVQVALAALQMRGVQMVWYDPDEKAAAEASAKALLEGAVKATPRSIPVLQAYCRFLSATNQFAESLVACGRAISLDPWDGSALYLIGLGQLNLGRFEDALATFEEAERYDTPAVSRWTWPLGAGWASLLLGRFEDAATDIERSIAITPGSGRSHMLLAVAYHGTGRIQDAKAALAKGMELRPSSTLLNFSVPMKNSSPRFVEQSKWIGEVLLGLGLPAD